MASSPASFLGAPVQRRARQRALVREYKDNPPPMGIYAIRCAAAPQVFVNASLNVRGAINRDRFQLKMGGHPDRPLQAAWRTHGEAAFSFEVIDVLKRREEAPDADYRDELAALLALWRQELSA
ncbi:MAG: GIY-YIG nuclease family protein [Burkholderiales bacterium]|nr:GIY-YIG nuclease family protein [Burkholderiales bacterium]